MDIRRIGYGLSSIPLDIGPEELPQEGGLEKMPLILIRDVIWGRKSWHESMLWVGFADP